MRSFRSQLEELLGVFLGLSRDDIYEIQAYESKDHTQNGNDCRQAKPSCDQIDDGSEKADDAHNEQHFARKMKADGDKSRALAHDIAPYSISVRIGVRCRSA